MPFWHFLRHHFVKSAKTALFTTRGDDRVKARDLWNDVEVTQGTDFVCTSYKIMSTPSNSRGKKRESHVHNPLEEIQVDIVPNPEPIGISTDSRFNYYLILCD